jgi:hypothetical protein
VAGGPGRLLPGFTDGIKRVPCWLLPAARQVLDRRGELPAGHRQCQCRGGRLKLRDEAVPSGAMLTRPAVWSAPSTVTGGRAMPGRAKRSSPGANCAAPGRRCCDKPS